MLNMEDDLLSPIYGSLNWSVPGTIRCDKCSDIAWSPTAGSYPSSLAHYESVLGHLPELRTSARILFLLQDPRSVEKSFSVANPTKDTATLEPTEHHYFCLTPVAWHSLNLDRVTGSATPCWPNSETAPHFLHRYLSKTGSWSYDGFLTYFLHLLRPDEAVITNLAKCHFGDKKQTSQIYKRCASIHLSREESLLQPNLLISFTSQCNINFIIKNVPELASVTLLNLLHPAARVSRNAKLQQLINEVKFKAGALEKLGYNVSTLLSQWEHDVSRAALS